MDTKFSGFGQIPPDLQSKLGMQGNSQFPVDPEQITKKVRRTLIATAAVFVLITGLVVSFIFFPYLFAGVFEVFDSGPLKGKMLDLTYVADQPAGGGKVWIVTNPSFTYVQTVESPGSYSVSSECAGCKIRVYIYDPQTATVQTQWDIPLKGLPLDVDLDRQGDTVWMSARQTNDFDPFIYKYDAKTGTQLFNTDSFLNEFKQLTAPIVELSQLQDPIRYQFKLADGKEFIFVLENSKLYANQQELEKDYSGEETITVFGLTDDSSDERKKLFSITGARKKVAGERCDSHAASEALKFFCEATSVPLGEEVFLEAIIIYQDANLAVIFHQDSLGRNAKRLLTAYDIDGKKLWTVPQERLFDEIKHDPENSLSSMFFVKNDLSTVRDGDVFVFSVEGVGAIGINAQTGAELWKIRP